MKIGMRLGVGFALVLLLTAGAVLVGMSRLSNVNGIVNRIAQKDFQKVKLCNELARLANDNGRAASELFLLRDKAQVEELLQRMRSNSENITKHLDTIEGLLYTARGKALLARVREVRAPH